ncbi:DivIVA domain-containing protein [Phycicoccus sp. DTK01]|uniref:DivIVA domain-containing protein n=1 Tax=Phycicoccus sp. DTK01 TaxID=2785745 RepID=UPI001A8C3125|nr:DivIVA domain-containing protein [Phycicoccus sp. DTK01]GIL35123.1 hypothetical protein PDTK01_11990 [Phycicoccus sp. DTK01]
MLTSDEVRRSTFTQTQFRDGYDEGEVDDLLDAVADALRAHEGAGPPRRRPLTAADVRASRLSVTRMRRGYEMGEVDALLERAAEALAAHEGERAGGRPAPAASTTPPAATGPREGLGARLLRVLRGDPRG